MEIISIILWPIIIIMNSIFLFYKSVFSSVGLSIILLSFTFSLILLPIRKKAEVLENRISVKINIVNNEIKGLRKTMKGEDLFYATEKVYKKYGYHPIYSIGLGSSFFVMLPVLISAIILFLDHQAMSGESFIFINDLSKPDNILGGMNLLPLIMLCITIIDARFRFKNDKYSRRNFYIIALILFILVYNLPSGLILYWIGSNIFSAFTAINRNNIDAMIARLKY